MWLDLVVIVCFILAPESSFSVYYGFPLCSKASIRSGISNVQKALIDDSLLTSVLKCSICALFLSFKGHLVNRLIYLHDSSHSQ